MSHKLLSGWSEKHASSKEIFTPGLSLRPLLSFSIVEGHAIMDTHDEIREENPMAKSFRTVDLLDVLIRLEERGRAFYGDLAARSKSVRARELFALLSAEELQHEQIYRDLKRALESAPESERSAEDTRHLDTLIRQSFAFEEFRPVRQNTDEAWQQALEFAIRLEKNTASYIREIRSIFRNEAPEIFERVLAEEERHLKMLLDYRNQNSF